MNPSDAERETFVDWLSRQVVADARGDLITTSGNPPSKRLWLGRLAPEEASWRVALGERGQRLEPSAAGFRFRPRSWAWTAQVSFVLWIREGSGEDACWVKTERIEARVPIEVPASPGEHQVGHAEFGFALRTAGITTHGVRLDVGVERTLRGGGLEVTLTVVNETADGQRGVDGNLYEVRLAANVGDLDPIELDSLPDTFRYDRDVWAAGVYGGAEYRDGVVRSTDAVRVDRRRPDYWDDKSGQEPDLSFRALSVDPLPQLRSLVAAHGHWGAQHWSDATLEQRARDEAWTTEMLDAARAEAARFAGEHERLSAGLAALEEDVVLNAFRLTNQAFLHSSRGKYDGWRPFQLGFLLGVLPSLVDAEDARRDEVDILWFATGGGKTETYLAAIVLLCLHDRMTGKAEGITAWSRFPLRMLSLQQTQRFADALAGAELQRQAHDLGGAPFAMGFLVGGPPNGTPNRIRTDVENGQTDANDPEMPARHRVLLRCPFCFEERVSMRFSRRDWTLEHRCGNPDCPWEPAALPFYCVDEEIYRFLPSVVVGTLDKAASVSIQAALRGVYDAPWAQCSRAGHGFTYAPRKKTPIGCLVPDCSAKSRSRLGQPRERYAPTLRVQDELHLLRDSLGAIDSHYETLLDHLQEAGGAPRAKILASSATLAGFEQQSRELYARPAAVFPMPGPAPGRSFWTMDSPALSRRFLGLAPRGQTLEFANDRAVESLQRAVRRLLDDAEEVAVELGIPEDRFAALLSEYGTDVVYGTKLRDVEGAARSFETQPGVEPLNVTQLTGRTHLNEVLDTLARLDSPESSFEDRIHVVCASSMMSHGVDVDRFNVLTMMGQPLATAEFIQTSARIGRRYPGLVLVLHRMGIERDSSIYRAFPTFVEQGDRFVEPVPITRRSKRVLDHTFAGLFAARVLGVQDRRHFARTGKTTVMATSFRELVADDDDFEQQEFEGICRALRLDPEGSDPLVGEVRRHVVDLMRAIGDVAAPVRFTSDLTSRAPMISLRQVGTSIPVFSRGGKL